MHSEEIQLHKVYFSKKRIYQIIRHKKNSKRMAEIQYKLSMITLVF